MVTPKEMAEQRERLYESSSLRDDLGDEPARILLEWGEQQVLRLGLASPDNFEQKCRFLRQLLKGINRFVGQREFNDRAGQQDYLDKFTKYLGPLGFAPLPENFLDTLPTDAADLTANLNVTLQAITITAAPDALE